MMVKPTDQSKIVETDNVNRNETLVMMRSDHETVVTQGDARGATIAIAVAMDPMDVTRQTQYRSLTSMEKDRVGRAPTRDYGNTSYTPT